MQDLHPSQQVGISDENVILDALASLTAKECYVTFSCPSHSGDRGNELAGQRMDNFRAERNES